MDDDRRSSDGIVIAVAILLVLGLAAGGLFVLKARVRRRAELAAIQALRQIPTGSPLVRVKTTMQQTADGDFYFEDSNGDWVAMHAGADGTADTVFFGIDCGPAEIVGHRVEIAGRPGWSYALEEPAHCVSVVRPDGLWPSEITTPRLRLATIIRGLPNGAESVAGVLERLRGEADPAEDEPPR